MDMDSSAPDGRLESVSAFSLVCQTQLWGRVNLLFWFGWEEAVEADYREGVSSQQYWRPIEHNGDCVIVFVSFLAWWEVVVHVGE